MMQSTDKKFLSHDQQEEHVSCPVSLRVSIILKTWKVNVNVLAACMRSNIRYTLALWYTLDARKTAENSRVSHNKSMKYINFISIVLITFFTKYQQHEHQYFWGVFFCFFFKNKKYNRTQILKSEYLYYRNEQFNVKN